MVLVAVAQNGHALEWSSKELKADWSRLTADREEMLAAVAQNGSALRCASEELKGNMEVVLVAVAQNVASKWRAARTRARINFRPTLLRLLPLGRKAPPNVTAHGNHELAKNLTPKWRLRRHQPPALENISGRTGDHHHRDPFDEQSIFVV